jgi:hypothetical protein
MNAGWAKTTLDPTAAVAAVHRLLTSELRRNAPE